MSHSVKIYNTCIGCVRMKQFYPNKKLISKIFKETMKKQKLKNFLIFAKLKKQIENNNNNCNQLVLQLIK